MSPSTRELHRSNTTMLLKTVAAITQRRAAELADLSESMVSRWSVPKAASGEESDRSDLDRFLSYIAGCNLMLVPRTYEAIDPDELRALRILAGKATREPLATPSGFGELG